MAVELLLRNRTTGTSDLVPVATSQVFRQYWLKGCAELKLELIPRFEDGITDFTATEIPRVIEELRRLRKWFEETEMPQNARALASRVDNTINAFERALNEPGLSIG